MKRVIPVVIALLLILPAFSHAGSATSRWDASIGGFVKFDYGYASQTVGANADFAQRSSRAGAQNALDENWTDYWVSGETRLNVLIKGPAAWRARTSAFMEGDFRGEASRVTSNGTFALRHAYMKFDWPTTSLLIGQTWQVWGIFPCLCLLRFDEEGPFNKGIREPQITVAQYLSKSLSVKAGITSPSNSANSADNLTLTNGTSSNWWPSFESEIIWKAQSQRHINGSPLLFAAGGFIGSERIRFDRTTGKQIPDQTVLDPGGQSGSFGTQYVTSWAVSLRGFIPIVPEKAPNRRAGSLGLIFAAFTGQNLIHYITIGTAPYNRGVTRADFVAPTATGGWAQLTYYLTHKLSVNGQAGYTVSTLSRTQRFADPNSISKAQQYVANVVYDVNAAIRAGVEGSYVYTRYGAPLNGLDDSGAFYSARFVAYYFF